MTDFFASQTGPRVFATPLGVDFCAALIAGIDVQLAGRTPDALARLEIWVANARMQRRLETLYLQRGPGLLPRIRPVLSLAQEADLAGLPAAVPALRLRLVLADLVGQLIDRLPDLAPRSALYDLADGLADLMGEMFEENVAPERLAAIDVGGYAEHWQRAQALLELITRYVAEERGLSPEARQAMIVARLAAAWATTPPDRPILVAGSTGSRGTTAAFMAAVAGLPQGAVILPGIDRHMPREIWESLLEGRRAGLAGEDHPQFRLAKFAQRMGIAPWEIPDWHCRSEMELSAACTARNAAVSLALRPAPVTDQWRAEGPSLSGLADGFADVVLVEAESPQMEAAAVALRLREAVAAGERAALISPDRNLTRQVTAALDRWGIRPDDSAGTTLAMSAPGRLLRHVAELALGPADAEALIVLLKHPLCHSGSDRGRHLLRTRDLELHLRTVQRPVTPALLQAWAAERATDPGAMSWAAWVARTMLTPGEAEPIPLTDRVAAHIARTEAIAAGPEAPDGSGGLYEKEAGARLHGFLQTLSAEATVGAPMSARDYADFLAGLTEDCEVREPIYPHADVLIWGTQEARVQGADLVILSGLNEGTWPAAPAADPWLNRDMRGKVGLRLPDRSIGLAAHDFQQAIAAPKVWLSRAKRDTETDTVPSRWLNRLTNLLSGSGSEAAAALDAMRARGARYLAWAALLKAPVAKPPPALRPAPRPAPVPPVWARPTALHVTQFQTLIRDPYAIYAQRILRLAKLDALRAEPDARLRGSALHLIMERFALATQSGLPEPEAARDLLLRIADETLEAEAPWPVTRRLWRARLARIARRFLREEAARRAIGTPLAIESKGSWEVPGTGVMISGKADRIDVAADGSVAIYDYKSGKPPSAKEEEAFNQQLWIEALMVEAGAFGLPCGTRVSRIAYLGLGNPPESTSHDISPDMLEPKRHAFAARLAHMRSAQSAFPSRRAAKYLTYRGDYDQLARHGEWDDTMPATRLTVGATRISSEGGRDGDG
jgi:double-strand break repair protein AddB